MAKKNKKRRAQKTRQRKQEKRKQNRKTASAPVNHLSAHGLKRLVQDVDLEECGLVASFAAAVTELDERVEGMLKAPLQVGYPELLALRTELEAEVISEERVDAFLTALEKIASARKAYGALMAGLEEDSFIDVLWREVFGSLREGLSDSKLRIRAELFLDHYGPAAEMNGTDLESLASRLGVDQDHLQELQTKALAHPALIRFAEFYSHLVERAKFSALYPLLTESERRTALAELDAAWAERMRGSKLADRVLVFLGLKKDDELAVLAAMAAGLHLTLPLDGSSWIEVQTDPESAMARLSLAAQQLATAPDESVALLEGLELDSELALRADEILVSAFLALGDKESLARATEQALARLEKGEVPEGLDPAMPRLFFERFQSWPGDSQGIDWEKASLGTPSPKGTLATAIAHFRSGLESGFFFAWESVIRQEQGLPLTAFQEGYLSGLPPEEGRLEFIDGLPRPKQGWDQELRDLVARVQEEASELMHEPDEPGYWLSLRTVVRERAVELTNPGGLCDPWEALDAETRYRMDRELCFDALRESGPVPFFATLIQLRRSVIAVDPSPEDFLSRLEEELAGPMLSSLKEWLALAEDAGLASRLALFDYDLQ